MNAETSIQTSTHSDLLRILVNVSNVAFVPDLPQSAKGTVEILLLGSCRLRRTTFLTTNAATGERKCDRKW